MKFYLLLFNCILFFFSSAQAEKNKLIEGNIFFKNGDFTNAEKKYNESLKIKKNYTKASFNLGNTYYRQQKFKESENQFNNLINSTNNKDTLSGIYHNLGNSFLRQKNYKEAVAAYKNAMKLKSTDEETRYNLAYAIKKLNEEQKNNQSKKDEQQKNNNEQHNQNQMTKQQAQQIERERIAAQQETEGAKLALKATTDNQRAQENQETEGFRLGMEMRKQHMAQTHQRGMAERQQPKKDNK